MMSPKYLLFGWLVLVQAAKAQMVIDRDAFVAPAKVILLNNDTIYGTTVVHKANKWNDFKGMDLAKTFVFQKAGDSESITFHPKKINGFQVQTSDSLWATFVSSVTLPNFDTDEGGEFIGKLFLLKITEGKMSLYHCYHVDRNKNRDGTSWWEPKDVTKILYKKGKKKIYHSDIYEAWQSKLINFVNDCPLLVTELKAVKCKGWSFSRIADYYNQNCE